MEGCGCNRKQSPELKPGSGVQQDRSVWSLTGDAGHSGEVPLPVVTATDGGGVSLDEARLAVVADHAADLIARLRGSEHSSVLHHRRLTARH